MSGAQISPVLPFSHRYITAKHKHRHVHAIGITAFQDPVLLLKAVTKIQIRLEIAWKLQVCNAVAWLVVEACWVRRNFEGKAYGYVEDLITYYAIGIPPALLAGTLWEALMRKYYIAKHSFSAAEVGRGMSWVYWPVWDTIASVASHLMPECLDKTCTLVS